LTASLGISIYGLVGIIPRAEADIGRMRDGTNVPAAGLHNIGLRSLGKDFRYVAGSLAVCRGPYEASCLARSVGFVRRGAGAWSDDVELNTRGRYAVMAMADLARQGGEAAVPLSQISERQRITVAYLEQLFQQLRRAGLVESARGRSGGYRLGRPAREITVAEVMAAVEEGMRMTRCMGGDGEPCMAGERCLTHNLWEALGAEIAAFLEGVSLEDVVNGLPGRAPAAGETAWANAGGAERA